ncbi:uncharacterized protein F5147DRAFT_573072 [Suillus discolor]|uniref:Uncharacterized protein n=1 Tax=Suillus discolor TaxID=1912936 RepID=A0A9P7JWF7_9AGAM|nr:uncharacterized protein F5147DRAFT_573072 [Suillus discolor]KAG2111724.1 hypothetical protein F5147DRAFT_573072 [Suillus discolor]
MKETYGANLLVFQVFCDTYRISEENRCPISPGLLLTFLSSCASTYSGSSLANYATGLKVWHLLHGQPWLIDAKELSPYLKSLITSIPAHAIINCFHTHFLIFIFIFFIEHLKAIDILFCLNLLRLFCLYKIIVSSKCFICLILSELP